MTPLSSKRQIPFFCLRRGFTLLELSIAIAIYSLVACGILSLFISSSAQSESAGNITAGINLARKELEDVVRRTNFAALSDYSKVSPAIPNDMSLACYVNSHPTMSDIKIVRIVVCYREKGNRIMGEDTNLDGNLSAGEDINGDNRLTSPTELATYIARTE